MSRKHVFVVALLLAVGVVFGVVALARTTHVGAAARTPTTVSGADIARRSRALDGLEASLRRALAKKPPKLPAVPATRPAVGRAPAVTYVRPAPIVIHRSASGGEREHESEHDGGGLDD
jgi:hypothetical protein